MQELFLNLQEILTQTGKGNKGGTLPTTVYPQSCFKIDDTGLALTRIQGQKVLCEVATCPEALCADFQGQVTVTDKLAVKRCPLDHQNAQTLRRRLPWTAPVSLRDIKTTIGCGDRLGRATPGHLQAVEKYDVAPVLAQQSIRELNLTGRTFENVVDDVTFLVLQQGYTKGYGADGDHLKTLEDIGVAVDAGMAMITLDLTEVMCAAAEKWSEAEVNAAFADFATETQERIQATYADKSFDVNGSVITINALEAKRCAVMYVKAMDFAREVYDLLCQRRGDAFDLEISIDETEAPTLPAHHLFIIKELLHRKITISSMAPRFIGEFQKAIDYIGDLAEFERQFAVHCDIAKAHGNYKISIHSGSDKFSAYPTIGRYTAHRVHVKTAGTSWLEAVRAIADCDADLYRDIHRKAFATLDDALKFYHITPNLDKIPALDTVKDKDLVSFMDQDDARQVVHVTYGFILNDPAIRSRFFSTMDAHEEIYYAHLKRHFLHHLETLGLKPIA